MQIINIDLTNYTKLPHNVDTRKWRVAFLLYKNTGKTYAFPVKLFI